MSLADQPGEVKYCERCGHSLGQKEVGGRVRPCCPGCGHIVFFDPKVAAVVLVARDGQLLLVRRGIEPAMGRWSFPAGYVDRGEVVEEAAIREVKEETGLDVRLDGLVGVYSTRDSPVVLAVYSAHVVDGSPEPGPEVQEVAPFPLDELPPLPFPHDYQILEDWRSQATGRG